MHLSKTCCELLVVAAVVAALVAGAEIRKKAIEEEEEGEEEESWMWVNKFHSILIVIVCKSCTSRHTHTLM